MIEDDDGPKSPTNILSLADIAAMSIDELEERIVLLENEIVQLRQDIKNKQASKLSADSVFNK